MLSRIAVRRTIAASASRQLRTPLRLTQLSKPPSVATSFASSRQFSWAPWRNPEAAVEESLAEHVAPTSTNPVFAPESILTEPHPDLSASPARETPTSVSSEVSQVAPDVSTSATYVDSTLLPQPPADAVTPSFEDLILHSGKTLEEVLNSEEAIHAAMKVADLKLIGYEHGFFNIMGWFTDGIVSLNTAVGLPWWGAIAATTIAIRLALSPILISVQKHNVRFAAVQPEFQELMTQAKEAGATKDVHLQSIVSQKLGLLMKEHNVNPLKPLMMPLVQLPIFLIFFNIVKGLANLPLPQFKEGGFGWVTDLTASDPYYILPATSLLFTNLVFKLGADGVSSQSKSSDPTKTAHIRNIVQVSTFITFPFIMYFPSAILCYWTFSTGFTLLQSLALRQPLVKKMLGLPSPVKTIDPAAVPFKEPSYKDTFKWVKSALSSGVKDAQERAVAMEAAERNGTRKNGKPVKNAYPDNFMEKIQEPGVAESSPKSPSKTVVVEEKAGGSVKQQRIDEARRRRAQRH